MIINPASTAVVPPVTRTEAEQPTVPDTNIDTAPPSSVRKKRGIADMRCLWPQNSTVRVSFVGLSDEDKEVAKAAINKWQPYINLKIEFVDTDDGDIRIGTRRAPGGQSLRGTDAKNADAGDPTMKICFTNDTRETSRVIQHEFGHALGIIHEHQHPGNLTFYDMAYFTSVYGKSFATQEFSAGVRAFSRLREISSGEIKITPYDDKSIMHYAISDDYSKYGKVTTPNYELSPGDKHMAETLYPPENRKTTLMLTKGGKRKVAFEFDPGANPTPVPSE